MTTQSWKNTYRCETCGAGIAIHSDSGGPYGCPVTGAQLAASLGLTPEQAARGWDDGLVVPTGEQWASVRPQMRDLANGSYPLEACGFIFVREPGLPSDSLHVVAVTNVAAWPYAQYQISPDDTERAFATGRCVGVWHSHPVDPAVPSELDAELAVPGIYHVIYAVQDEDLAIFLQLDGQLVPQVLVMPGAEPALEVRL